MGGPGAGKKRYGGLGVRGPRCNLLATWPIGCFSQSGFRRHCCGNALRHRPPARATCAARAAGAAVTSPRKRGKEQHMKDGIHPKYQPAVFVDGDHEIVTRSTLTSAEKRVIGGVEHSIIHVDISSYTHPFYTGKQRILDTAGRVERFRQRYAKAGSKS